MTEEKIPLYVMFPIELPGVKTNPAESTQHLGVIFD